MSDGKPKPTPKNETKPAAPAPAKPQKPPTVQIRSDHDVKTKEI